MIQKTFKTSVLSLALLAAGVALAPNATAQDNWNKRTLITVNRPIEVPGKVIPAGRYILELAGLQGERNVVRISDEDGKVFATVIAIPDYRREATESTTLTYYEAAPGSPRPLRQWFYPNDRIGVEFVYPKRRAVEIAAETKEHVIAEAAPAAAARTVEPSVAELLKEPVVAITPAGREVPVAEVHPPAAAAAPAAPAAVAAAAPPPPPPALPKTASPLPLIVLIGIAAGAGAVVLRKLVG